MVSSPFFVSALTAPTAHPGYARLMPWGRHRYCGAGDLHFITCSCYQRQALLGTGRRRDLFLSVLERMRRRYQFVVVGYVVMPEHLHLLMSAPQERPPSVVMQALKLGFARRVLAERKRSDGCGSPFSKGARRGAPHVFYAANRKTKRAIRRSRSGPPASSGSIHRG